MINRISQINSPDIFVKLCKSLFSAEFNEDFQTIDDSGGDGGNDGYSAKEEILFQIYCPKKPEKINDSKYREKIKTDLGKAKTLSESREYKIKKWIFVTPGELRENVQTYIRIEAKKCGFVGISWSAPKLEQLLLKHSYIKSQFPDLILPDLEHQHEEIKKQLDSVKDMKEEYSLKLGKKYNQHIDRAKELLDKQKWKSAKEEYEAIIKELEEETEKINPHLKFRAYNNLALCEFNLYNNSRAIEFFEKAYYAEPEKAASIGRLALSKFLKGELEDALSLVEEALKKDPDDDYLISVKANILRSLKKYPELIKFLKEKGKNELMYFYRGIECMDHGNYSKAVASFENVLAINQNDTRAMMLIVQNIMTEMKDVVNSNVAPLEKIPKEIKDKFLIAIKYSKDAIKILEDSEQKIDLETVYANLAGCYTSIGRNDEAIEAADEAIRINSFSPIAFVNRGLAQLKKKEYNKALVSFNKYKSLEDDIIEVDQYIVFCYLKIGSKLDEVEKIIEDKLHNGNSLDLDFVDSAINLYSRKLDDEKISSLLDELERDFPDHPRALSIRASYLKRHGFDGAELLFKKALSNSEIESDKMFSEIDLADFYYDKQDYKQSAEIYKRYIDIEEGNNFTLRYVDCLFRLGNYELLLEIINTFNTKLREEVYIKQAEAYANFYLENLDKSSKLFKDLFEKNPKNIQYLIFYGMAKFRLGYADEVKKAYDAIKNLITEPQELIMLSSGYEMLGDFETAMNLVFRALKNDFNNPKTHMAFLTTFLHCEQVNGKEIKKEHIDAFQDSIKNFNQRFPEEKMLRGFKIENDDYSEILNVVANLSEVTDNATNLYKESKIPMAFVPKIVNRKPFDVWSAFISMPEVGIKMSFGNKDELEIEIPIIKDNDNAVVLDIYPFFLLAHLKHLELLKYFKKIYVHQSIIDNLTETIEDLKISSNNGLKLLGSINGKPAINEISAEKIKETLEFISEIKKFLIESDNVEICGLTKESVDINKDFLKNLDSSTGNSVLLSQELKVPFLCDDRILKATLIQENGMQIFSSQNFFRVACERGLLSLESMYDIQREMIDLNYSYLFTDAVFIFYELKRNSYNAKGIQKIISVLAQKETTLQSLGSVLANLFLLIIRDELIDIKIRLRAFIAILKEVGKNHDLAELEEIVFINLQQHIDPQRKDEAREIIVSVFSDALKP